MRLLQHINLQANIEHNFHNKIGSKNKNKRKSDSEDNINFPSKLQITKLNKSGICLAPTCFFLLASPHTHKIFQIKPQFSISIAWAALAFANAVNLVFTFLFPT
jgi:hypothetical protein